jgi:PAS domain S-box-containing protein
MESRSSFETSPEPEDDLVALRRRVESLSALVDAVEGIVWEADPETCCFTYVNRQAERLLGYPVERWVKEPNFWPDHIHPGDRDWVVDFCANCTPAGEDHQFEYRMIAADGRTVWLKDIVTVQLVEGRAPRVRGVMVDISAHKSSEQRIEAQHTALLELANSEQLAANDFEGFSRLATEVGARTLDVERISVWLFNSNRSILRCHDLYEKTQSQHSSGVELRSANYPAYFSSLTQGRAVVADNAHSDEATREFSEAYLTPLGISSMLDAPLRRGGAVIGVLCHEHVGKLRRWTHDEVDFAASVADFVSLALESHGRRKAEVVALETYEQLLLQQKQERQRIQAELEKVRDRLVQSTRLSTIGQVAASIAHELRNPLSVIENAAFYLKRHFDNEDEKCTEHLAIIGHEVKRANRIITDLLEMSRAKDPGKEKVDLHEAVKDALGQLDEADTLRLRISLEPDPFLVDADPIQLRQVLSNLIANAIQALDGGGTLGIRAHMDDGMAVIEVSDDGPGVPSEHRNRIFQPLFSTKARGTGLGLSICRQIAERHGGAIELLDGDSGARFEIRLPPAAVAEPADG